MGIHATGTVITFVNFLTQCAKSRIRSDSYRDTDTGTYTHTHRERTRTHAQTQRAHTVTHTQGAHTQQGAQTLTGITQ